MHVFPSDRLRLFYCLHGTPSFILISLAEWLQPQISAYKDDVLPRLFASLQAPSEQVQIKSLYAMNCFSDQLGDDIIPYLPAMMQQLALMIQTGSLTVKENTVLAIASAAIAAGKVRQAAW